MKWVDNETNNVINLRLQFKEGMLPNHFISKILEVFLPLEYSQNYWVLGPFCTKEKIMIKLKDAILVTGGAFGEIRINIYYLSSASRARNPMKVELQV